MTFRKVLLVVEKIPWIRTMSQKSYSQTVPGWQTPCIDILLLPRSVSERSSIACRSSAFAIAPYSDWTSRSPEWMMDGMTYSYSFVTPGYVTTASADVQRGDTPGDLWPGYCIDDAHSQVSELGPTGSYNCTVQLRSLHTPHQHWAYCLLYPRPLTPTLISHKSTLHQYTNPIRQFRLTERKTLPQCSWCSKKILFRMQPPLIATIVWMKFWKGCFCQWLSLWSSSLSSFSIYFAFYIFLIWTFPFK